MNPKSRLNLKHVIAIVVVVIGVGVLYLVLANLIFSRTYEMLSAALEARGKSNASELTELVSWGLAAQSPKEVLHSLETFQKKNADARTIIVLDAKRKPFASVGVQEDSARILSEFENINSAASKLREGHLLAIAPVQTEAIEERLGYVIYSESSESYLKYRQNVIIIALLASVLGLIIVGKLLHAQITVSMDNAKLYQDLEQSNEELSSALTQAKISAKVKNEFLANTSHELRTPLNAIINIPEWFLQVSFQNLSLFVCRTCGAKFEPEENERINRETLCPVCEQQGSLAAENALTYIGDPEQATTSLNRVVSAGRHLLGVINDLLDISTLELGKMEVYPEEVSIQAVFENVAGIIQNVASKKNISLHFEEVPREWTFVVDQVKFSQILINLVGNAIKFSQPNTVVEISAERRENGFLLKVKDYGMGIKQEEQSLIFEAFRQAEGGNTRNYGGTGLGLAVTRKLVALHRGEIWVESELGAGSTFYVEIPTHKYSLPPAATESVSTNPKDGIWGESILVVDDDMAILENSVFALDDLGYDVKILKDPNAVIEKIELYNPRLVILDLMMPRISGLQILREIREQEHLKDQTVLISSGYYSNREIATGLGAHWIAKPWTNRELLEKVKEIIG